jgi:hypothetical protein
MGKIEVELTTLTDVLSTMAEEQMSEQGHDTFTLTDRKELIRHGLQLDALSEDVSDLKILFNEAIKMNEKAAGEAKAAAEIIKTGMEERIRKLEDDRLVVRTQLRTFLGIATLLGGAVGTIVELVARIWFK